MSAGVFEYTSIYMQNEIVGWMRVKLGQEETSAWLYTLTRTGDRLHNTIFNKNGKPFMCFGPSFT